MQMLVIAVVGFIGGLSSGLFGVGGGVVFVPLMVMALGFNIHLAVGTSLAIILPTAAVGLLRHYKDGQVDWKVAVLIALLAVLGSWIGAGLSIKLPVTMLRRLFAVLMIAVAVKLLLRN